MRKAYRSLLKWSLAVIVLIPCCVILFILLVPYSWIAHLIGENASARLDRNVTIAGPVHINWDWTEPEIRLDHVSIANLPGAGEPDMADIQSLDFRIRIWHLLEGQLNLPYVDIVRPKIILEKNAQGQKNWDFGPVSKATLVTHAVLPTSRSNFPMIGQLKIEHGLLTYRDDMKNVSLTTDVDTATGTGAGDTFRLKGHGEIQGKDFALQADGGSLDMLRNSHKAYPLDLRVTMGKTSIALKGAFTDPVKMSGVDAMLDLRGDDLANLFYLTLIPLPPSPPYTLSGHLKKQGEIWSFDNFRGTVGDSDIAGDLSDDTSHERGFVKADLTSHLLRMKDLSGLIGVKPDTQKASSKPNGILPDMNINLTRLRATDLDITLKAAKLEQPGWPFDNLDARFLLKDGVLRVDPLSFGIAQGKISGSVMIDGQQSTPIVSVNLMVQRLSLKPFFQDSRFADFAQGFFGGRFDLTGEGKSLATVMGDSNGRATLMMTKGKISKLIVDAAGLDISKVAPELLGQDQSTDIRCAIGDFAVKHGIMDSDIFVFDTTASNIHGSAVVDLKSETINAQVEAHPKQPGITLRTPIDITGHLKHPDIGLDPKQLSEKGLAAAALSFLTPLASIIPFIDLGLGKNSDCRDLIAEARAHSGVNPPAP